MSSFKYDGSRVNSAVDAMNQIANQFSSLSTNIRSATNQIVSARGFQEYVGGISSDTFSGCIDQCGAEIVNLSRGIRQKEVSILAYSKDSQAIGAFLNHLTNSEYQSLDLTELAPQIKINRFSDNLIKGLGASAATFGLGVVEGVADFVETGADLVTIGGTMLASIFTGAYDLFTGSNTTKRMWENTKAFVSEKRVENAFNRFYENNPIGQAIKQNAYGFDFVRGVGKGLGYTAGVIGVNVLTGGLAAGAMGAAGSISAGQLALTAGIMGFSNGTEEAWADGATIGKGLLYGAASGAWEGVQWYAGAKINQLGGVGDQVAKGIFKGASSGVGTRIFMDTIDSGLEGFVQPALTMIYKDYGGANLVENYKIAFNAAGGWGNVATQAAIGAAGSAIGEYSGARKLLKSADNAKAGEIFQSNGSGSGDLAGLGAALGGDASVKRMMEMNDIFSDTDYSNTGKYTIDGSWIRNNDTPFNTKTSSTIPKSFTWFMDGTYLPDDLSNPSSLRGVFGRYENNMSASQLVDLINQNKNSMSGASYTSYMKAADIFKSNGVNVNMNGLKLIVNHTDGNVSRIRSALAMSYAGLSDDALDHMSKEFANGLFPNSGKVGLVRSLSDDLINSMQKNGTDRFKNINSIIEKLDNDQLMKDLAQETLDVRASRTRQYFGSYLSEDALQKIAHSDGFPSTIRSILSQEGNIPSEMLDTLSAGSAATIFKSQNLARMKACLEINDGKINNALRLATTEGNTFNGYSDLFKTTNTFADKSSRFLYYNLVDSLVDDGVSLENAVSSVKMMNAQALTSLGRDPSPMLVQSSKVFSTRDMLYTWHRDVLDTVDNSPVSKTNPSLYLQQKYLDANGGSFEPIIADFERLVNQKQGGLAKSLADAGVKTDLTASNRANQTYLQTFVDAARDLNNPNRADVVGVMGKILELDSQGKHLLVFNDGGVSGSFHQRGKIQLDNSTLAGKHNTTTFHETGHYLYETVLGARYPQGFEAQRAAAVSNLSNPTSKLILNAYSDNIREVGDYCSYRSQKQFTDVLKTRGYSGVDDFRDYLITQYTNTPNESRAKIMGALSSKGGNVSLGEYERTARHFDYKNAADCADFQIRSYKARVMDHVYRTEFPDYCFTSGIIDSVSKGDVRYQYGHGPSYFLSKPDQNYFVYHELMADYTAMKASGNNQSIRFLRAVLGDQIMDQLDADYQRMIR